MATTKQVKILASYDGNGQYGLPWQSRLVERDGKYYLVHDQYCGESQLRGGQYRPFVYAVPIERVAEAKDALENWMDWDDNYECPTRVGSAFEYHVLPELHCIGEQRQDGWQAEL